MAVENRLMQVLVLVLVLVILAADLVAEVEVLGKKAALYVFEY